ncbi:MAG TPA: DUF488 domain-containing protein [Anaerolineales bacterium]
MPFKIKRAYDPPAAADGQRILVDRLWPRGVTKEKLRLDAWMKELSPSNELRRWIHSDPSHWAEFKRRYFKELDAQPESVADLRKRGRAATVTLVFSAKDPERNNAAVLKEYLERR